MTREEADFIGGMNMCDEISNEAYRKIMCHCEEQEPCEDAISRQTVLDKKELVELEDGQSFYCISPEQVETLQPVTPQPKMGHWVYDHDWDNWKCSECGESPKTIGYVGSDAFMAEHFKYCNHCGAKMEESEDKENE